MEIYDVDKKEIDKGVYERTKAREQIIQRKKIIDTKEDFYYLDSLKNIPEEYWNQEIWLLVPYKRAPIRLDAHKRLRDFLNERFILHQLRELNLEIPIIESIEMTQREVWYYIEILAERDNMVMDSNYKKGFVKAITDYCKKIKEIVGVPYWAYVFDILKIKSKARATIYDEIDLQWVSIGLDKDTLKNYTDAPFFLILCEKEGVITAFLKEIVKKGYNKDYFYCLNLGGEASSNAIRLIREYVPIKNFHCYVLHDIDMSGLEIFFDMKRHFNCKSIGVNPEFLEYHGYDFNQLCEKYKTVEGKKLERVPKILEGKTRSIFNELDISVEEKETYNNWIEMCIEKRIELNSITARKIESDPSVSKAIDFVDYFIHILKQEKWDLTRVRKLETEGYCQIRIEEKEEYQTTITTGNKAWTIKPELDILQVEQPEFIDSVKEKGKEIFIEESKAFLEKTEEIKDLSYDFYSQIEDIFDTMNEKEETNRDQKIDDFIEENKQLFEIDWNELIKDKKKAMKHSVKRLKRCLQLKCINKYIITKRRLMNYIGSIKDPKYKIKEAEDKMGNKVYSYRYNDNKKIIKLNKELKENLKETINYKEAKEETLRLTEKIDKLEIKEDKRLEYLENFKKRIEEAFTELIGDLNEFNNETND
ncbi:MAG: hypothetical protein Lokiarch_05850 [Candidatus Lokiarchaeum sp. GC14_75]|nr:MAG: hypothetical protein Lokiarch_05850 [Candidatus Lokiarchaeum sp. GC14_75]